MRVTFTAVFVLLLLYPLSAFSETHLPRQVTIGVLTDLSGFASYYGQQTRAGALLAQKEVVERGGKLKLVFEDSMLNTSRAVTAVQNLIYREKVDALYVDFSLIAIAVSSIAENKKIPFVYAAAARSVANSNFFARKTYSDYREGCEAIAREFSKRGIKKIGVLHGLAEYGDLCLEGVQSVYPQAIVEDYDTGSSVATQMLKFKRSGAEAIVNGCFEGDVNNMLQERKNLQYAAYIGVSTDSLPEKTRQKYLGTLDGSLVFGLKLLDGSTVAAGQALAGDKTLTGIEGMGTAWLHIHQLYDAAQACAQGDGECVLRHLDKSPEEKTLGFQGWKNRMAQFEMIIQEVSGANLHPVGAAIRNE